MTPDQVSAVRARVEQALGKALRCPYCAFEGCACNHSWGDSCRCLANQPNFNFAHELTDVIWPIVEAALRVAPAGVTPSLPCYCCSESGCSDGCMCSRSCPKCHGEDVPCDKCKGSGRELLPRQLAAPAVSREAEGAQDEPSDVAFINMTLALFNAVDMISPKEAGDGWQREFLKYRRALEKSREASVPQGGEFTAAEVEAELAAEVRRRQGSSNAAICRMLRAYARALSSAPGERT
jgi:hypothetical protein